MRNNLDDVGTRLRRVRNELKETQEVFAQRGAVTQKSQANYEKGLRTPNTRYWLCLFASGIDILYVLTGEMAGEKLTRTEQRLIREIGKLDGRQRELFVMAMIELLKTSRI
ncbi:XRE family transcriptional regulator [Trinickia caryophylli]|uniref:HTH cro/C1-type domain-containing protein n=1 Tax=Trinickia caryophylli TaxID=28094 RepID=A0A1X7H3U3_TRICW|nr:hypothetical protein [Trinickia caryophylli]PMS08826.1 XRE family transcriptional regulator [Trinickia caryophylli]TRX17317.1 XRE family transcriptional regulator [Trinickia caryophylli]WQE11943.1 XRE family transcriptional regulator [Trinickia caryophylli]SMF79391.1 hypothetical protein SAMN06295900_12119 [Trinickia caryophylli]GLU35667.1 hypothetical protein Busp01_55090 [Trinickia caryophylli]